MFLGLGLVIHSGNLKYGDIFANKESETGITIHYVNENYDEGAVIFQAKCEVDEYDTADDVASKIHKLEMEHFPKVVDSLLFPNE